ncbi:vascular cell adhesion protein 1-like [Anoplopoma fimbria]|uniref:vascular cell adhesion protein 1-like n=1 Tax=Anoplopoma fimbria TaxID=229290 RepID=UPI0023EC22F8|nr:vascular cell adhesion protein 1-like [Anoplopoma fimbria]
MGWEATKGGKATNERVITWTVEKVDSWDEQPLCYINVKEKQCTKALNIILYKTPDNVLVSAMDPGPMVEGREYRLNCFITNVAPLEKLKLIWYRGDETMLSRVFSNTTKTPTNVSFDLKVTPNRADNRAHFRCAAELHLGPNGPALVPTVTSSPYEAVVHYAPVFNGSNSEEEVNVISGDNVTLDCSADGNPHPEITWKSSAALNVMVTTRGRQKSIIVTEATSTNAGSYVCVARNVVGNVDKTVKLVVKDRPQLKAKGGTVIWWFLILLIILLILILAIYVHLSRRQGRYTFVPNEANQDPGIPMTPQTNGV